MENIKDLLEKLHIIYRPLKSSTDNVNEEKQKLLPPLQTSWTTRLTSLAYVFLMVFTYALALICSQISGLKVNIFLLTSLIYTLQIPLAVCVSVYRKSSLKISREDSTNLICLVVTTLIYIPCFYGASIFMAVGNLDALHNAFFIVFAAVIDVIKRVINGFRVCIVVCIIVGTILLAQPWAEQPEIVTNPMTPCDYYDHDDVINRPSNNSHLNGSFVIDMNISNSDSSLDWFQTHPGSAGYMLLILAAAINTAQQYVTKTLIDGNPMPALIFWGNLLAAILALICSIIWSAVDNVKLFTLPSGSYCLLFTILYVIFAALGEYLGYYAIEHLQVSTYSISLVLISCILYVSQRTFLKPFHPGHANTTEIIGLIIVVCGTAIIPVSEILANPKIND